MTKPTVSKHWRKPVGRQRSGLNPTRTTPPCYNNTTLGNPLYAQHRCPIVTNPICWTCKNCSHECAADWTLRHTIQHRAVLIIFPLNLQTITLTDEGGFWHGTCMWKLWATVMTHRHLLASLHTKIKKCNNKSGKHIFWTSIYWGTSRLFRITDSSCQGHAVNKTSPYQVILFAYQTYQVSCSWGSCTAFMWMA